eukprot:CFRG2523T1
MNVVVESSQNPYGNGILYIGFNQDQGCFSCGLENGFRIYNCDPVKLKTSRQFNDGGLGHVEMLFRCNFLAMVGGGRSPKYPPNKVLVWDDRKQKEVIELEFKSVVTGVRLRRDRIVVALTNKVFVYTFSPTPQKLSVTETADNPNGLIALCPNSSMSLLAFPGRTPGHVQLIDLSNPKKSPTIIAAHETSLSCLSINIQGDLLATASEKGTLIRIFDTQMGIKLHELRRGAEKAQIYSINFNSDSSRLCVSSDKGTIHVFDMAYGKNKQSSLVSAKSYLPKYFSSTWSFAKFSVPAYKCICAFTQDNCVLVLSIDGSLYKYSLTQEGEAKRESFSKFLEVEE